MLDIHYHHRLKRVAYVYKAKKEVRGTNVRVIWGYVYMQCVSLTKSSRFIEITPDFPSFLLLVRRVTKTHGNSGVVKGKFKSNLPPHSFGASVRVVSWISHASTVAVA